MKLAASLTDFIAIIVFAVLVIAANASDVTRTLVHGVDGSVLINDITPGHLTADGIPIAPTSATYRSLPYGPAFYPYAYRSIYAPYYHNLVY